jgi:hypothetical protein
VGPRAYSAAAIASIRRAYRKSERDPLIGNLSEDEFAKPRKRLVVLVEEESKQISGQATAVDVGTGSSNPNVWRSGSLRPRFRSRDAAARVAAGPLSARSPLYYSEAEVIAIVEHARTLPSIYGMRGLTCSMLLGLHAGDR